ncbi:MAG TPA: glutamate--tRNA ligase [Hyphomonas sp.]|jgi:glutamyl-tRNA synthetase|uniref:glutamate--tRNA ligase n=3 Tax=Hyphomonas TaxID=85 RepID=UPI000C4AEBC2|nr:MULTISPECIES: glutamate--tRNA ligase [unclassified Hyphomonas]MAL43001.1 glutamate--tRNA ligase [Hyphomonas sp.]MAX83443.1 glutamate--tRNA ligase [Hyphomonas sp.]HAW56039.1 glutamate--tRNA ligase [Hyphomonas sp.]HBU34567.1 glutamate--tRNA ligase [Hyphomonas sp.]HBX92762.1 glutamate--tRNA ligase [Hyphomonas sp.]|tara:strand:+ start:12617 stop:13957 length:1341 start_codon:yes stop_codon:yes gene_type:complete
MTAPIVRFAPSPTGRLHVGNVRTALINWLFAKGQQGKFILRIDDTDTERSTQEYEDGIRTDLTWLGLVWDDSFSQSKRFAEYDAAADKLREMGLLYPCYETADELDRKRKIALSRGRPPVYDRAALELSDEDKAKLEAEGRTPHWRFKLSGGRVEWTDLVRGDQSIDTSSLSDPILIREDGSYLYTLPSVVDDIEAKITHVVRGEDHVTNSGAQIEIFKALGGTAPDMAHTPLLIGADGQGLSKRLGSLSMGELRAQGYEPMAVSSLLAKIGTSDNVEARETLGQLVAEFDFGKIGRAPARFDETELLSLNAAILHGLPFEAVKDRLADVDPRAADEAFWTVVRENCSLLPDVAAWVETVFGEITPLVDAEDKDFVATAATLLPEGDLTGESWSQWANAVKAETGRKGRGLFMTLRKALTGQEHGPDMGALLPLIGRERALKRLQG